ncbi:hypothetical protein [Poriferisphaera sp. WC338]|uniref:hypothetical protein n=1 Tax=Poriferisphaera sp. WC338 TaxID=3425129 RepID=UPI003D8129B7
MNRTRVSSTWHLFLIAVSIAFLNQTGLAGMWHELDVANSSREEERQEAFEQSVGASDRISMQQMIFDDLTVGLNLTDWKKSLIQGEVDNYVQRVVAWRAAHVNGLRNFLLDMRIELQSGDIDGAEELKLKLQNVFETRPRFEQLTQTIRDELSNDQEAQFDENVSDIRHRIDAFTGGMSELDEDEQERAMLLERRMQARLLNLIPLTSENRLEVTQIIEKWSREQASWWIEHRYELATLRMAIKQARLTNEEDTLNALSREWQAMRATMPDRDQMYTSVREKLSESDQNQFDKNVRKMQGQYRGLRERMLS